MFLQNDEQNQPQILLIVGAWHNKWKETVTNCCSSLTCCSSLKVKLFERHLIEE